ncbi:MAG: hypothetical protein WBR18_14405 [Anaerolineales bacterium]
MPAKSTFYLGRTYDLKQGKRLDQAVEYDPDDLTTHGVVVGMTGSGKTGLCIDLLEEAALQGIPALLVDPKGDLTNLLLHFPSLAAAEFEPWVDSVQAERDGKTVAEVAAATAETWRQGLQDWGIEPARVAQVAEAVDYSIYTPGAESGMPVDILSALKAPQGSWQDSPDRFRDKIATTTTALLGLVGIEGDPVKSREHILLSNLLEAAWRDGQDVDLVELIRQVQNPPFEQLGALSLDQFFPSSDRAELAMTLNNLLASPSFEAWTVGEPLDIERMLWRQDGTPRHSVFYLAHLADGERMFFVTLLLGAIEAWMRGLAGSPGLRALFYMDEVAGYLPPVAMPPSKPTFLRLLKQARAFGLGLLLSTQNPVDLDYKALSNAGSWFIGRLQTEQDKARLLDGLESVDPGESGFNRAAASDAISKLDKRVFLLHDVHEPAPIIFQTRWAMAYLKGPITLQQVDDLNQFVGASAATKDSEEPKVATADSGLSTTRPALASGVAERFAPLAGGEPAGDLAYSPSLLAHASVRFLDRKLGVDQERSITALDPDPDPRGMVQWEQAVVRPLEAEDLAEAPKAGASFTSLAPPLSDRKLMGQLEKDFDDFVYRTAELSLTSNPELDLVAQPEETEAEFQDRCLAAASQKRDEEAQEMKEKYQAKIEKLKKKLSKEQRELGEDQAEFSSRRIEEWTTHAENLLGLFGGSRSRRRVSSSLSKRRMTTRAKADIEESEAEIAEFQRELEDLEDEMQESLADLAERWAAAAEERDTVVLTPRRQDVQLELFGVLWLPHWRGQDGRLKPGFDSSIMDPT